MDNFDYDLDFLKAINGETYNPNTTKNPLNKPSTVGGYEPPPNDYEEDCCECWDER